ncbi:hypothetical protein T484DRAFT_1949044 [Baffinella frigidus]|nr:hypothetical protein T484DRAFT_1949044 [Cryptophyta sp. CCMP2293]
MAGLEAAAPQGRGASAARGVGAPAAGGGGSGEASEASEAANKTPVRQSSPVILSGGGAGAGGSAKKDDRQKKLNTEHFRGKVASGEIVAGAKIQYRCKSGMRSGTVQVDGSIKAEDGGEFDDAFAFAVGSEVEAYPADQKDRISQFGKKRSIYYQNPGAEKAEKLWPSAVGGKAGGGAAAAEEEQRQPAEEQDVGRNQGGGAAPQNAGRAGGAGGAAQGGEELVATLPVSYDDFAETQVVDRDALETQTDDEDYDETQRMDDI